MKQLKTDLIVLCDYASVSQEGKLSIDGIFEEIKATSFPAGLARGFLVTVVEGSPSTSYSLKVEMMPEKQSVSKSLLTPINLDIKTGPNGRANILIELINVAFPEEGEYAFKVYQGEESLSSAKINVMHKDSKPDYLKQN